MRISFTDDRDQLSGALAVFALKGKMLSQTAEAFDARTGGAVRRAMETSRAKGDKGKSVELLAPANMDADRLLVAGLGDADALTIAGAQAAGGAVAGHYKTSGQDQVTVFADPIEGAAIGAAEFAAHVAYGALLKSYSFDKYFTKKSDSNSRVTLKRMVVVTDDPKAAKKAFESLEKIAEGVFLTRDLVSEPANIIYPESLADACRALASLGVEVDVLGEERMAELGMGALLGVGQGSARESQLVVMEWNGAKSGKKGPVTFVGKGVTFDTGGISIKPAAGMEMMKWDMGGAGAVIGLMKALAGRKAKVHAVGIVGLVENMPSSTAQRPGDVVTSMSGQTIEVINTDAEGRLVLADALHYAQERFKPQFIVDLATLTGAIITSLGNEYAGLFSNDDTLSAQLAKAGEAENEKVWRFPLTDAYDKMINSQIADMKNVGTGGKAGSITAAQFLQRFIRRGTPWAHLDIAGTAWTDSESATVPKGGTGYGVRLLNRLVADHYEGK
ncbi:leucyl aminopeptidase [Iodidimonas sp. SYSU 1G8]|uniref:leucyl aminopeptidase n=1 Tax=Iodidimonas sp. SYSU 1G8 TaxID=3133967 RepID=UPI0031FEE41D